MPNNYTGFIGDLFPTTIAFAGAPSLTLHEKRIKPPSLHMGGGINRTSMRNTTWRTQSPKVLKSVGNVTFQANYGTALLTQLISYMGTNDAITVTWADTHGMTVYGWIDTFDTMEGDEGTELLANLTVEISNINTSGLETGPVNF